MDFDGFGYQYLEIIRKNELTNKNVTSDDAVEEVRKIIKSTGENQWNMKNEFIMKFLNARKMNPQEAFNLIRNYYLYRDKNKELFENMSFQDAALQQALHDGFPGVLTSRDRKGRCVLLFFCNNWNCSSYPLEVIYKSLLLSLEKLLNDSQNQINGFVVIVDWSDITFKQLKHFTPRILKLMIYGLQDCFPVKFKGIHFTNQTWFINPVIILLKALVKEKMKSKIFVHGNNLSTLHNHISIDILPSELGGEGPPYNPTYWANLMLLSETN